MKTKTGEIPLWAKEFKNIKPIRKGSAEDHKDRYELALESAKLDHKTIAELEAALEVLARKISGVSRLYAEWRCPSHQAYERCGLKRKYKLNHECAECISRHAKAYARHNLNRRKK